MQMIFPDCFLSSFPGEMSAWRRTPTTLSFKARYLNTQRLVFVRGMLSNARSDLVPSDTTTIPRPELLSSPDEKLKVRAA